LYFLTQVVAPTTQVGPTRIPRQVIKENLKQQNQSSEEFLKVIDKETINNNGFNKNIELSDQPISWRPIVRGSHPYQMNELQEIFHSCGRKNITQTLKACASSLSAKLISDGFINTRVFINSELDNSFLEIIEGKIVEIHIDSSDELIKEDVNNRIAFLKKSALHIPTLKKALVNIRNLPEIGNINGNLGRLGSDPTKAVLNLTIDIVPTPLQGEITFSNDGNDGTGQWRGSSSLLKKNFLKHNDIFLTYFEFSSNSEPEIGTEVISISYKWPFSNAWDFTSSLGYSDRKFVDFTNEAQGISFEKIQFLGQLEKTFYPSATRTTSIFFGGTATKTNSYLDGKSAPFVLGGGSDGSLSSGYLKVGINFTEKNRSSVWNGSIYGLQGLSSMSNKTQLTNLEESKILPGEARAIGGMMEIAWLTSPSTQINFRGASQWAFNELISDMGFSLGSDIGIKGIPGTLTSGDSGWLITNEIVFSTLKKDNHTLQIIPFIGIGEVMTARGELFSQDEVGSIGVSCRYIKNSWSTELGWFSPLETQDNSGKWEKSLLGDGLYTQIKFRF
tara:strand:+ start:167 stop:1846 length:1680 start_codon:yes stop_codon:yes gene_type:complete